MSLKDLICGLDIGSDNVRLVVGQRILQESDKLHIIGAAEAEAEGITKGVIVSLEDAISSISACIEKAERMTGRAIEQVWVGISGSHIISQESKGVVAVAKANSEINEDDVHRAIEAARTVATPPNYEILHVIPKSFIVDGQKGIKDPIGMTGIRLEVDTQIIQGLSSQTKNLTKAVYRTGLEIQDIVLSILATSEAVLTNRQKELGVAVINIGGSTTSMAVFEEGDVLQTVNLPIGSEHITSDIAIGLRISIDAAEKIKLEYGSALPREISKRDEVDIGELNNTESVFISRRYIAEIIEARVEEILEKIDLELKKIDRDGKLPAGIVLTGAGAKLTGLVDLAKSKLRLPACLGYPLGISSAVEKINDPAFATAVGLVLWGAALENQEEPGILRNFFGKIRITGGITKKFKNLIKSLR
ncbi:cell division protein FtsA [Candidatus Parcubacteria bacterium]|nr:MAG: cell division protein FtsA [Candidatus Parcubacteria bacterium]